LFSAEKDVSLIQCAFFGKARFAWIIERKHILAERCVRIANTRKAPNSRHTNTSIFDTYTSMIVETLPSLAGCSGAELDAINGLTASRSLYSDTNANIGSGNRPLSESAIRFAATITAESPLCEWKCLFRMADSITASSMMRKYRSDMSRAAEGGGRNCTAEMLDSLELNLVNICIWCYVASKRQIDISYPLATAVSILSEVALVAGRAQPGFPKMSELVRAFVRHYRYPTEISMSKSIMYRNRVSEKHNVDFLW
jgi:hypothetical protein